MPVRDFTDYTINRAKNDPAFRRELLVGAVEAVANGEVGDAKLLLRDYVLATDGFEAVAAATGKKRESLSRMLSAGGNPTLANLATLIAHLKGREDVTFVVRAEEPGGRAREPQPA